MKNGTAVRLVLLSTLCLLLSLPALADSQLYTNGPINGNFDQYFVGTGVATISDSFGLGSATISSISFGAWVGHGDTPLSITWSISSDSLGGGTVFASGTSSLTNTLFCTAGPGCLRHDVYTSTFLSNLALGAGSYYLNFSDSATAKGGLIGWDVNRGIGCAGADCPTQAYQRAPGHQDVSINSESFSLYGDLNAIPEPSTVLDLLGSGTLASIGLMLSGRVRQKLLTR